MKCCLHNLHLRLGQVLAVAYHDHACLIFIIHVVIGLLNNADIGGNADGSNTLRK